MEDAEHALVRLPREAADTRCGEVTALSRRDRGGPWPVTPWGRVPTPVLQPGTPAYKRARAIMAENEDLLRQVCGARSDGLVCRHNDLPTLVDARAVPSAIPSPRASGPFVSARKESRPTGNSYADLGREAEAQIRRAAAAAARRRRLTLEAREDLEQEIACRVIFKLRKAPRVPKGARAAPLQDVVRQAIWDCLDALDSPGSVSIRCERSLDEVVFKGKEETLTRADILDHGAIRRRWTDLTEAEAEQLRADIAEVLARLPADLRRACEAIRYSRDTIEAAKLLRMPRSALLKKLARARPFFEAARARGAFRMFRGRPTRSAHVP